MASFLESFLDPGDFSGNRAEEAMSQAGDIQMSAAQTMMDALLTAVREGISYQEAAEQRAREDVAPWREAGVTALDEIGRMLKAGPGEFTESPGYQFRLGEGVKALDRSAASRGNVLSGAQQKGVTRFGQDYATNEYDNFLRRYYEKMNPHFTLAGYGSGAAGTSAGNAMTTGTTGASNLLTGTNAAYGPMLDAMNSQAGNVMNLFNYNQQNAQQAGGLIANVLANYLGS